MGTVVRDSRQLTPLRMRMRDANLLFFTFSAVSGHSFGWGWNSGSAYAFLQQNGLQTQLPRWRFLNLPFPNNPPNPGWLNAWEEVDQVVREAPPKRLMINWANNVEIVEPNATTSVGLMTKRPRLTWPSEPGALYTVMVIDAGIQRVLPRVYMHWMVTNIPGNSVELGNEVMEYVTPFSLEVEEDPLDSFVKDRQASAHPMIFLVYKQPGHIQVEETQRGCSPDIVSARIHDYRDLASKYNLQLKAGNYLQCPWSGSHTLEMVCRVSKCTREAFPFPIPGVNDLEECQPRQTIQDLTIVGPRIGKWKEYAKYRSLLSLDSITSEIKNLYPNYSTGKIADFVNIEGAYDGAPIGTNNQPSTLEEVVDVTFLEYPNKVQNIELFKRAEELITKIPKVFPHVANSRPLKVLLSQPHDQDWDFMSVLNKDGMVMDVNVVKVKEGREEDFQVLRDKLIDLTRSSKNVVSVTKFDVERDIMEEGDPIYLDYTNNEMWISVFESMEARQRAFSELTKDKKSQAVLTLFFDSFECILCSVATANLPP